MRTVSRIGLGLALLALSGAPALAGGYGGYGGYGYEEDRSSAYSGEEYDHGYHAWGGGERRTETSYGAWRWRRTEEGPRCWGGEDRDGFRHHALPPCGPEEVTLGPDFFVASGGVGGFPEVVDYGGGGVVFAGAGARASAFASASARVSIRFRGGFKGHHGGRHGCGCR